MNSACTITEISPDADTISVALVMVPFLAQSRLLNENNDDVALMGFVGSQTPGWSFVDSVETLAHAARSKISSYYTSRRIPSRVTISSYIYCT